MPHSASRILATVALGLSLTAGTAAAQSPSPQAGSEAAVQGFLRAVADSNLEKMAQLWGTSKGAAAKTHEPSDYDRRIVVMQAYLHGAEFKILSNTADQGRKDRRTLQVELTRDGCDKIVPFTTVRTRSGSWIVSAIELGELGSPGRQCGPSDSTSAR